MSADLGAREPRLSGDALGGPEIVDRHVDLEPFEPGAADAHLVARRGDRKRLLTRGACRLHLRLNGAAQLGEDERRQIVEIRRAEVQRAIGQLIRADRHGAVEMGRGEAQAEIVKHPSAVRPPGDMRRPLKRVAVDVAGQRRLRFEEPGEVTRLSLQREAGDFAIEQPAFAEGRLQASAEIVGRPGQRGDDRGPADHARIDNLDLGQVDPRIDVDLVACVTPVEPRGPVRARRHEVGEAEAPARHRPRGAGQPEIAAGDLVEKRIIGDELRRMGVEGRIQRAIARRSVEVGREASLALERGPGERRKAAEVARCDLQPAANGLRREEAGITRVEIRGGELERIEGDVAA